MGLGLAEKTRHCSGVTEGRKGRYGGMKVHLPELRKVRERQCPCWALAFASFMTVSSDIYGYNVTKVGLNFLAMPVTSVWMVLPINNQIYIPGWEKKRSSTPSSCQEASETIYPGFVIVQVQTEPEHCKHLSVHKELMRYGVCAITLEWV